MVSFYEFFFFFIILFEIDLGLGEVCLMYVVYCFWFIIWVFWVWICDVGVSVGLLLFLILMCLVDGVEDCVVFVVFFCCLGVEEFVIFFEVVCVGGEKRGWLIWVVIGIGEEYILVLWSKVLFEVGEKMLSGVFKFIWFGEENMKLVLGCVVWLIGENCLLMIWCLMGCGWGVYGCFMFWIGCDDGCVGVEYVVGICIVFFLLGVVWLELFVILFEL